MSPFEPPDEAVRIVRRHPLASMITCTVFLSLSPEAPGQLATGTYTGNDPQDIVPVPAVEEPPLHSRPPTVLPLRRRHLKELRPIAPRRDRFPEK